ncbi:MAG: AMP-binding protein [Oscillospiraceae bacterium]|nr:AMP-binding protein [Oscillospiraceae bacterium]
MLVADVLRKNAAEFADEIALVEINPEKDAKSGWKEFELVEAKPSVRFRREITWQEFDRRANRFANLLLAKGYKKGDKIAILLMNSIEWLPIYFGVLKMGGIAVPFNFRYSADEILYCLKLSEATALIIGTEFIDRVAQIKDQAVNLKTLLYFGHTKPDFAEDYRELTAAMSDEDPMIPVVEEDDAAIYFSSGTTGFPKAILHTHSSVFSACVTENKHHSQTHDDIFLCIPPLYHTGAKMHWFGSFLVGGRGVILKGIKPEWILRAVSEENCTIVWLLVPWAQDILDAIDGGELNPADYQLDQWRLMHIGAQPVPPSLIKRWKEHFPKHDYDTNYGLSESIGPGCVHLGVENIHKVGAIGVPGYGWEIMIADEQGNPVKQGDVGELYIKGPGVMKCYYNDEKATAATLKNGWLLSGDMAKQDEDGFIYLVDRKKDVIITGGENIYPVQIEDFLRANQKIKDVAVIGLPEKRLGEITAAIIEVKPGMELMEEEVNEFCLDLPRYKRPRKVIFDSVPRNPTGKIEKPKLRERYCAETLVEAQMHS